MMPRRLRSFMRSINDRAASPRDRSRSGQPSFRFDIRAVSPTQTLELVNSREDSQGICKPARGRPSVHGNTLENVERRRPDGRRRTAELLDSDDSDVLGFFALATGCDVEFDDLSLVE